MTRSRFAAVFCALTAAAWVTAGSLIDGPAAAPEHVAAYVAAFFLFAALPVGLRLAWGVALGRSPAGWLPFLARTAVAYHAVLAALMAVTAALLGYNNEIAPARLPVVVLEDGRRTVTFRAMAHVASPEFYAGVQKEAAAAKASGAILFYEGVRPGSPAAAARLNALLGADFGSGFYAAMAEMAGLTDQLSFPIAGVGSGAERNVDLSMDEVVAAYDAAAGTGARPSAGPLAGPAGEPFDPAELARGLGNMAPGTRRAFAYAARAVMNFAVRNEEAVRDALRRADPALAAAILDARDRAVARAILDAGGKDVYATYGLMHFQGVYDALRAADPRWNIREVRFETPIR